MVCCLTFGPNELAPLQIAAASAPQALPATTSPEAVSSRHPSDMTSATQISQVLFMIQLPPHSYLCLNRDSDSDPDIDDDSAIGIRSLRYHGDTNVNPAFRSIGPKRPWRRPEHRWKVKDSPTLLPSASPASRGPGRVGTMASGLSLAL
ncbi:hypothetical protein AK812_SmicGene32277 [Symbiodinium microadriaticum]|uniref:Uncharacterized protein n=1 Tax=Symbiodinium microadriaticum TaxID=2951 RepID=A0A1Q9CUM4_SYMMI|nr:hypothetical protein AK812_SmicGene32277 [Symbiodinium microadriaticum]